MDNDTPKSLKAFFEKTYKTQLTEAEAADYKNKLVRFFNLLIEIDQKNKRKEAIKNGN